VNVDSKLLNFWVHRIDLIVTLYRRLDKAFDDARFVINLESELCQASWTAFETLVKQLDYNEWIAWYVWENKCGERQFSASAKGAARQKITNSKDLAKLILLDMSTEE
jgi:hypothetical protein